MLNSYKKADVSLEKSVWNQLSVTIAKYLSQATAEEESLFGFLTFFHNGLAPSIGAMVG